MKRKTALCGFFPMLGIFLLILDGKTALAGAQTGLDLCIRTVIPGLFPFFLLTGLLNISLMGSELPLLRPLSRLMGIPEGGSSLLIPGLLGGYPMGARAVAEAYGAGVLDKSNACRLLYFLNNCGPAFFFGFLSGFFPEKKWAFLLWGIHLLSALLVSLALPVIPGKVTIPKRPGPSLTEIMESSLKAMGAVCGWILCFRVMTAILCRWFLWRLPVWGQILVSGMLEITGGLSMLELIPSVEGRFLLAAVLVGAGGLCVAMQTVSVLGELPVLPCIQGKLLQTMLSGVLALSVIKGLWPWMPGIFLGLGILLKVLQKRGGNPRAVIV